MPPQEGSRYNLIEHNVCEEQKDDDSGCMGLRGDDNTVRWNDISDCEGAGVRIGGDDDYGEGNNIYGNTIRDCEYAAFKVPVLSPSVLFLHHWRRASFRSFAVDDDSLCRFVFLLVPEVVFRYAPDC